MEHEYILKLEELGVLKQFKANCNKQRVNGYGGVVLRLEFYTDDGNQPTFKEFVKDAFNWEYAKEGYGFWYNIARNKSTMT